MKHKEKKSHQSHQIILLWKGSWLGCLLRGATQWSTHIDFSGEEPFLKIETKEKSTSIQLTDILDVKVKNGKLWSNIIINAVPGQHVCIGIWRWKVNIHSEALRHQVEREISRQFKESTLPWIKLSEEVNKFLAKEKYIRHSDVIQFRASIDTPNQQSITALSRLLRHPFTKEINGYDKVKNIIATIEGAKTPGSEIIRNRNKNFVANELKNYKEFFDTIEKTPLTEEQRLEAVIIEDRNLLIAGAGSGKSSTLIGKAAYAIHRRLFEPNEVLALAFNKKAAQELNQRSNLRIKPKLEGKTIKSHTFHGLGYAILRSAAKNEKRKIRVASEKSAKPRLQKVLNELTRTSPEFSKNWVLFLSLSAAPVPADDAFESEEDYKRYIDYQRQSRKDSAGKNKPAAYEALTGDIVQSAQELAIANWLFLRGIPFDYEKPFSPAPDGWNKLQPDFYFPEIDVWYEHFALDASGKAPPHFGDYASQAQVKRDWVAQHAPGRFFETRSHQYYENTLFSVLETSLKAHGQSFRALRSDSEILERIQSLRQIDTLDLILKILGLVKGNAISQEEFSHVMSKLSDRTRSTMFKNIFWPLFDAYNKRLRDEVQIDYDDMIVKATEVLEAGNGEALPYKFILVDEFQDLSIGRARFIKALLRQHSDSVLFGVGDDWQAINGFAGSDLRLFLNFETYFGASHQGKLTKTFRCPQGISDVSAHFIQQNKLGQISKLVRSELDATINGVVDLIGINKDEETTEELERQLEILALEQRSKSNKEPKTKKYSVFILGRYRAEKTKGISQHWLTTIQDKYSDALVIEFTTVHKSKGLEADYIFLLGLNAGPGLNFPSTMISDPLLSALLSYIDPFPYAEERRLFYVALTRAKRRCFIMFRQWKPSPFVLELMKPIYKGKVTLRGKALPELCLSCKVGSMLQQQGKNGLYLRCSFCRQTKSIPIEFLGKKANKFSEQN